MFEVTKEDILLALKNYKIGSKKNAVLVWAQPNYEPGSYYTICRDRASAARVVRELRKKYRRSFTHYDGKKRFNCFICYLELPILD